MRRATALLVIALAACTAQALPTTPTATAPPSAPAASHGIHDAALDALRAELTGLGLTFELAGPHHVLGVAADGVEVDLIGIPLEEAVLSIPANQPDAVREAAEPYLAPIADALGATAALDGWLTDQLNAWNGTTELRAEETFGDLGARLRSTSDPAYVVLTITRA